MDTNAQNTLVILFQHVDIFCAMLDHYSDDSKTVVGFKVSAYEAVIARYLETHVSDMADKRRIRKALSINNMDECGLLSFIDDRRGQFALQRGLLQTIQNLDSKRIRELGQPDLDIIYAQMKQLHDYFIPKGGAYDRYDPDFQENLAALFDVLQDTLTKIDHNVRALDGSSKRLSEILDSHDFNKMVMTDQVRSALAEVIRISKRNIRPTLIFLNEKAMATDASAMYLLHKIRNSFESTSFHTELANITTIEMKLLSYAEVISDIRRRMNSYVEMDRRQRELYNTIEQRFNELHSAVVSRLDTKLGGKKVPADDPMFALSRAFKGLHNWSTSNLSSPLIELPEHAGNNYALEYIRMKMKRANAINSTARKPTPRGISARESYERAQRTIKIKKVMELFNSDAGVDDLYQALHNHLQQHLSNYSLKDIYDAMCFISNSERIRPTLQQQTITYNSQKLTYLVRIMETAAHA